MTLDLLSTARWIPQEIEEEEVTWTEHLSSSGRIYYFNEKLKKSQWERPKGLIKKWVLVCPSMLCFCLLFIVLCIATDEGCCLVSEMFGNSV